MPRDKSPRQEITLTELIDVMQCIHCSGGDFAMVHLVLSFPGHGKDGRITISKLDVEEDVCYLLPLKR